MTTSTASSDAAPTETTVRPDLPEKQRRILRYLRERVDERTYFKSRVIGQDLDLSAKEVGANIAALRKAELDLDIEKWGYSSGTTWQVTV